MPCSKSWKILPSFASAQDYNACVKILCNIQNKLYLKTNVFGRSLFQVLNLQDDDSQWKQITPTTKKHDEASAVVVDDCLYVVGGFGETSVEKYDAVSDKWTIVTNMPSVRYKAGVAVLDDKIYISGGGNRLKNVDCYDVITDKCIDIRGRNKLTG